MLQQPLLQIKNLSIEFHQEKQVVKAVKNIQIDLLHGEVLALVGESGSGKSITALSLLKLLPPTAYCSGQIIFSTNDVVEIDLLKVSKKMLQTIRGEKIAMIFQEPMTALNPLLTCGEQVMEMIQLHQKITKQNARKKTVALFAKVKLPDPEQLICRYPHELSGGQKQRVMIAMAICCHPALLIADEPTTALDVTVQKAILTLLKELQEEYNMSMLFITHDLGVVADIADKIAVMYNGEIVEQGVAKNIFKNPQHPYTKALIQCRPSLHTKSERLPTISDFMNTNFQHMQDKLPSHQRIASNSISNIALRVENLKVYFSQKRSRILKNEKYIKAVDDVSFSIKEGEIIGLVGESGCGKTTVGRAILNLIKPTGGRIILNQRDITQMPPSQLRQIRKNLQIVFQDPYGSLNPRITIGDSIMEPLQVHGALANRKQQKERVMDLLNKVHLGSDYFNRYPHQFSGGQRQRICIARALALNPEFLIFDESVSALDVSVQAQILNLIRDLRKELGFTAIFISHDLSVIKYISDRVMVMHRGKIVEEGNVDQIFHHPKLEYTQQLVDAIPGKNMF